MSQAVNCGLVEYKYTSHVYTPQYSLHALPMMQELLVAMLLVVMLPQQIAIHESVMHYTYQTHADFTRHLPIKSKQLIKNIPSWLWNQNQRIPPALRLK